jgi:hypothetical protein
MVDVLVTGSAAFIGSNFVRRVPGVHPDWRVTMRDKLTDAGRTGTQRDELRPRNPSAASRAGAPIEEHNPAYAAYDEAQYGRR